MEDYETKITSYAERIIKLTADIEKMEKNPDSYNDADLDDKKVEIKQVEALVKELQGSISGSKTVFESLRVQVCPTDVGPIKPKPEHVENHFLFQVTSLDVTLSRLEKTYDKNLVLLTRREYIKVQLQLEECERRHQEIFNPNIG